ncbi:MAG TPA: peptidoglycan DD-metalloendopeptidase family protein [Novimethylophilus sp.]|uniref:peptidoglycan DD-metalloendopeptidase family protein n=1 Tax=Novimethylophilus sp. TaxID=2137426 RepID=UPI002F402A4E
MQKKTAILSQNDASKTHKQRLHWLLGFSSIPLFGIVAAFAIAPQTLPVDVPSTEITEAIALPAPLASTTDATIDGHALWQVDRVRRDDTLASLLERINIHNPEAIAFLHQAPEASALASQLRPGRTILTKTTPDGVLLELQFQIDVNHALVVKKSADGYQAQELPLALENRVLVKSAEIRSSLFAATDDANIPDQIAIQLANIFSSEIDFNLDLRKGDRFTVTYEARFSTGELIKTGRVLSTEFINQGKAYSAILYRDPQGRENYYTREGKSLQKAFLRSPLEFSRISSGFTLARFHPILNTWRAHKGVDYAAPTGTLVKAVADATVSFVGGQGGYGNVVMLQHAGNISTVYGHLSRFAPGLHKGQRIAQGEAIGFVGMTGMATGPHLHYEFRVRGEHRDPLKVALPTSVPLSSGLLADFQQQARPFIAQLDLLRDSNLASME